MIISKEIIESALKCQIDVRNEYSHLGLVNTKRGNTLSFIDSEKFCEELNGNPNVEGVFITGKLVKKLDREDVELLITEDPRYDFYTVYNMLAKRAVSTSPSEIHPSTVIHPAAYVSDTNVIIGENTFVEPNVSILSDVEIGKNVIIRSGTSIGVEGFEHKRTSKGILSVFHSGKVIIGDCVEIGANNAISKGSAEHNTKIGDHTKTDSLVHIAHGVCIGKRCLLPASCMIAGSVIIEDDVWVGPGANISSQITVGKGAFVTLGAVVTKDVPPGGRVTGNFAIPHKRFLEILKNNIKEQGQ